MNAEIPASLLKMVKSEFLNFNSAAMIAPAWTEAQRSATPRIAARGRTLLGRLPYE